MLTKLTPEQQSMLRTVAERTICPDQFKRKQLITQAHAIAEDAHKELFQTVIMDWFPDERVTQYKTQASEVDAAAEAIFH